MEVLNFDKYPVKIDGSGRLTIRNRRFLRQYTPATNLKPSTTDAIVTKADGALPAPTTLSMPSSDTNDHNAPEAINSQLPETSPNKESDDCQQPVEIPSESTVGKHDKNNYSSTHSQTSGRLSSSTSTDEITTRDESEQTRPKRSTRPPEWQRSGDYCLY